MADPMVLILSLSKDASLSNPAPPITSHALSRARRDRVGPPEQNLLCQICCILGRNHQAGGVVKRPSMLTYPVILEQDGDSILVSFPDVPRAHTFGDSEADALDRAGDALETAFIALMADRKAIPRASPARGRPTVSLPPLSAAK